MATTGDKKLDAAADRSQEKGPWEDPWQRCENGIPNGQRLARK